MPGQWKNDEMIYMVPGQNIPKKDDVINVQSLTEKLYELHHSSQKSNLTRGHPLQS